MMWRWILLQRWQVKVRRSWPDALGSIAVSFIGDPQAVHCGPWFCVSRMNVSPYRLEPAVKFDARSRLKRHRCDAVRSATLSLRPHLPQSKLQRSNPGLPGLTRARIIGALHLAQGRRSILAAVRTGNGCDAGMGFSVTELSVTDDCRFRGGDASIMPRGFADLLVNRAQFRKIGGGLGSRTRCERDAAAVVAESIVPTL
jgi:hypothetical protein